MSHATTTMYTAPKPGQYFTTASIMRDRCTGTPKVCVSVNKSRVYYRRIFNQNGDKFYVERQAEVNAQPPQYCDVKSVQMICDSLEEIHAIDELAEQSLKELFAFQKAHNDAFKAKVAAIHAKFNPSPTTTP